jgi:hypothetical protein
MKTVTVVKAVLFAGVVSAASLVAAPASAQIPVGSKVGEAPMPTAGGYESLGRRDPFVSLIASRRPTQQTAPRAGSGLGSFFVTDVAVTGIVTVGDKRVAILQGMDKQSYVAKVGSRLADGVVKTIDASGVVLVEFADATGAPPREIRKLLHPVDEVKR